MSPTQHSPKTLGSQPVARREGWASGIGDLAAVQATAERVITHARKILNGLDT